MSFTCQCTQCNKPFQAKRSTAKFCSNACRVAFNRDKQDKIKGQIKKFSKKEGKLEKVKVEVDASQDHHPDFIPNWKRKGYKTKEEAVIDVIKDLTALGFPNTSIMWKGEYFTLNPQDEKSFKRVKRRKK